MRTIVILLSCLLFLSFTPEKISVLYRSLNPQSISQHLAFYQLFPENLEGKKALQEAWQLLTESNTHAMPLHHLPADCIYNIVNLITKGEGSQTPLLNENDLQVIRHIAERLPNRKLKGCFVNTEEEVLQLPPEEVDLARGLFLSQEEREHYTSYEALIDLMALQILTTIKLSDSPENKIRAINHFIFEEMGFRFPPHSVYSKDIDLYTYLPSVIDSRKGVCLGVSILYLALSQRLDLPLQAITPPGHIYVRYQLPDKTINIETTARGVHLDTKEYLGLEVEEFEPRTMKDVIGLAFYNEASVHWQNGDHTKALKCYKKAYLYLPNDLLLQELMGYNFLFVGEIEKGLEFLRLAYEREKERFYDAQQGIIEDYLNNQVDEEGLRSLYMHVDEKRESLLKKKDSLMACLAKWPAFRGGYFHLGVTWLQLHRTNEAYQALQKYIQLEKRDPTGFYILAELACVRSDMPSGWKYLKQAEALFEGYPLPETLKTLRKEIARIAPE